MFWWFHLKLPRGGGGPDVFPTPLPINNLFLMTPTPTPRQIILDNLQYNTSPKSHPSTYLFLLDPPPLDILNDLRFTTPWSFEMEAPLLPLLFCLNTWWQDKWNYHGKGNHNKKKKMGFQLDNNEHIYAVINPLPPKVKQKRPISLWL